MKPPRTGQHPPAAGCDVPAEPAQRRALQAAAERCVARQAEPGRPLEALAAQALAESDLPDRYAAYAAVMIHNARWQAAFAAVPPARRLLLLPTCLREADRCSAASDAVGLLCRRCGACVLSDWIHRAEQLGYAVLVCEGTAAASTVLASPDIEAVLGVGCLDSLQRVYPLIASAGLPALAVPLLRDGCVDTTADHEQVRRTLDLRAEAAPALAAAVNPVAGWFSPEGLGALLGPADGPAERLARQWLSASGKRWRPTLTARVYDALRGANRPSPAVRHLAVAVECFHKASLVHDDIEDDDLTRDGRPTLHAAEGLAVALNVGDLLLGDGYRCIGRAPVPPATAVRLLHAAAEGHRQLCRGQGAELHWRSDRRPLSVADVTEIHARKTAPAFEVALRFAAELAGADARLTARLARFARHLGIAYQIMDDLDDVASGESGDLAHGRPSMVLALAYQRAGDEQRPLLEAAFAGTVPPADTETLERLLGSLHAPPAAAELMHAHIAQARAAAEAVANEALSALLTEMLAAIFPAGPSQGTAHDADPATEPSRRGGDGAT